MHVSKNQVVSMVLAFCLMTGLLMGFQINAFASDDAFTDISSHWGKDYIVRAASLGLVKGMGDGTYLPEGNVTRAEFVQMVMNVVGDVDTEGNELHFTDVNEGDWYYDAINMADYLGITEISGSLEFNPNEPITREQMADMLGTLLVIKGVSTDSNGIDWLDFADSDSFDLQYAGGLGYAVSAGLMQGMDDNTFRPQGKTTRAQAATVLLRLFDLLN